MELWTDSHNHLQDARLGEPAPMINAMRAAGVAHCVVNATSEADWSAVESLALAYPELITPAFGIHPWKSQTATNGWQQRLAQLLEKHPRATVGECGIDRWVSSPPIQVQLPIFMAHMRLAREMRRPMTIHCLKAWGVLFEAFAEYPPPPRFLMHSFGGSIETARRLLPLGAYFSFSGYFMHPRKAEVLEVFRRLPREHIRLESDAPDMLPPDGLISHPMSDQRNHPANLPAIGRSLAKVLGMEAADFAALTRSNAESMFRDL